MDVIFLILRIIEYIGVELIGDKLPLVHIRCGKVIEYFNDNEVSLLDFALLLINLIGILNGFLTGIGQEPVAWLLQEPWNNFYLMVILIWLETGFAMVILSAAIKSVPEEIIEAARIDGASEWQVFRRVTIPSISSSIVVVATTVIITVWKVFDIVFVMTGGRFGTQVVAEQMVTQFFTFRNSGIGATLAVVLLLAVIPLMVANVRRFKEQELTR